MEFGLLNLYEVEGEESASGGVGIPPGAEILM